MDKIYIVMDYVEHDLKSLMETMKQPFLVGKSQWSQLGFRSGPEVIKLFPCSNQISMKFKLLINIEIAQVNGSSGLSHQSQSFILLVDVTIVGILTFMSRINFMLT